MTDSTPNNLSRAGTIGGAREAERQRDSLADAPTVGLNPSTASEFHDGFENRAAADDSEWPHAGDRFQIDAQPLGSGGMGDVFRAHDRKLGRDVALKFLKSELAQEPRALARFRTEARSQARLNHTNIVRIYDFFRNDDGFFISMELVKGQTLAESLRDRQALPEDEVVDLGVALCSALADAHKAGLIHRDIKPANILIAENGTPRLTDFGLVHLQEADHSHTKTGAVLGTFEYMSPEQLRNPRGVDARSDIWSLGATLYEAVVGDSPRVILGDRIPQRLQAVLVKALDKNPKKRFQNVQDFSAALKTAAVDPAPTSTPAAAEQLQAGQCATCGSLNDQTNEYCIFCRAELQEPCVQCEQPVGVWAVFCGKCGADVKAGLENLKADVSGKVEQVSELRNRSDHESAFPILATISATTHPAVANERKWAASTLDAMRTEHEKLVKRRNELQQKAKKAYSKGNYASCVEFLNLVEAPLHNNAIKKLLADAKKALQSTEQLRSAIESRIDGELDDELVKLIAEYAQLCPSKADSLKYVETILSDRIGRAETCRSEQRFQHGIDLLNALPKSMHSNEVSALLKRLRDDRRQSTPDAELAGSVPKPGWVVCPHCPPHNPHVLEKNLKNHIAKKHQQTSTASQQSKAKESAGKKLVNCPHCNTKLHARNLDKHIQKIHATPKETAASANNAPVTPTRKTTSADSTKSTLIGSLGGWLTGWLETPFFIVILVVGLPIAFVVLPLIVIVDLGRCVLGYDSFFENRIGPYCFTFILVPMLIFAISLNTGFTTYDKLLTALLGR